MSYECAAQCLDFLDHLLAESQYLMNLRGKFLDPRDDPLLLGQRR
jgi:hypothetical protein